MAMPEDDPPPGVPEWVVTYGDMMSLLLTFFIMLVSMAETKQDEKIRSMLDAWNERFGPTAGKFGVPGPSMQGTSQHQYAASSGNTSKGGTKKGGREAIGNGGAGTGVRKISNGQETTIGAPIFFEPGIADLTPTAIEEADTLAKVLVTRPNSVIVRGHGLRDHSTADVWSVSFARAQAVATRLIAAGVVPHRITIEAAGDSEPRVVSRDAKLRQENHRVDVFVTDAYTSPSGTDAGEGASRSR